MSDSNAFPPSINFRCQLLLCYCFPHKNVHVSIQHCQPLTMPDQISQGHHFCRKILRFLEFFDGNFMKNGLGSLNKVGWLNIKEVFLSRPNVSIRI